MADIPDYTRQPPPLPAPEGTVSSHDLVCEDLRTWFLGTDALIATIERMQERKAYGFEKYDKILHAHNGRDHLLDALDEVQDLVVYLKSLMVEMRDKGQEVPASVTGLYANVLGGLVELTYLYEHRVAASAQADPV